MKHDAREQEYSKLINTHSVTHATADSDTHTVTLTVTEDSEVRTHRTVFDVVLRIGYMAGTVDGACPVSPTTPCVCVTVHRVRDG